MSAFDTLPEDGLDADLAPVALIEIDARRCVFKANAEAEALFGVSRRAMSGRPLSELLYHDSPIFDLIDRAEEFERDLSAAGVRLAGPAMESRSVDVRLSANRPGGGVTAAIAPALDPAGASPQNLARFARILGHEVKNPLAGISGAAQLLLRRARDDQAELLELVQAETQRIERLVNRLSVFELFSTPRLQAFNLHETLDRVVTLESAAAHGRIEIERDYDPSLPSALGDPDHLHEAFQNLLRNAIEAASEARGAEAKVRVSTAYQTGFSLNLRRRGGLARAARVTVEDNGDGVPADDQARIFQMFETTKPHGEGLGLAVVKEIAAAHGGHLKLDSRPGRTCFSLTLALAGEEG